MIVTCTDTQEVPPEFFVVCDDVFWDEGWRGGFLFSTGAWREWKQGGDAGGAKHTCHTEIKKDEQTRHMKGWLNFRLSANTARGWKRKWRMFCRVLAHSPPWPLSRKEKPKERKERQNEWKISHSDTCPQSSLSVYLRIQCIVRTRVQRKHTHTLTCYFVRLISDPLKKEIYVQAAD